MRMSVSRSGHGQAMGSRRSTLKSAPGRGEPEQRQGLEATERNTAQRRAEGTLDPDMDRVSGDAERRDRQEQHRLRRERVAEGGDHQSPGVLVNQIERIRERAE